MNALMDQVHHVMMEADDAAIYWEMRLQCAEERIDAIQTRLDYIEARLQTASEMLDACWRLNQDLRGPAFAYVPVRHRRWVAQTEKVADFFHTGWMRAHSYQETELASEVERAEIARTSMENAQHACWEAQRELMRLDAARSEETW